jgi:hypothetical protein
MLDSSVFQGNDFISNNSSLTTPKITQHWGVGVKVIRTAICGTTGAISWPLSCIIQYGHCPLVSLRAFRDQGAVTVHAAPVGHLRFGGVSLYGVQGVGHWCRVWNIGAGGQKYVCVNVMYFNP